METDQRAGRRQVAVETYEPKVLAEGLVFGEGPRWRDGKLWISDMFDGRVVTVSLDGNVETAVEVQRPSGLGWLPDGTLLVVSMTDRKVLKLVDGRLETHADLWQLCGGDTNDMVVDRQGRAYVGNFGFDFGAGQSPKTTKLVLVQPDGDAAAVGGELLFPNGTAISPNGRTLVVAETLGARLSVFDVAEDGSLSNQRVFAELPGRQPDGICLDAAGAVWVSCFSQDEFVRVHEGGAISASAPVSGRRAVACMLGGADRRTLFLLTSKTEGGGLPSDKAVSAVETVRVETPGAGLP